jgi:hypothetical protein
MVTQLVSVAECRPCLEDTKALFYAFFALRSLYQFTPLPNLRSFIFGLTLFGLRISIYWSLFCMGIFLIYTFVEHCLGSEKNSRSFRLSPCRCNLVETPTLYIHDSASSMTLQKCTVLQTGVCRTFTGNKFVSRHEPESRDQLTKCARHGCRPDPAPKAI